MENKKETLKEKYSRLNHWYKSEILNQIAFKLGYKNGVYLLRTINNNTVNPSYIDYINKVFDKQIQWQEKIETQHYKNLVK